MYVSVKWKGEKHNENAEPNTSVEFGSAHENLHKPIKWRYNEKKKRGQWKIKYFRFE